MADIVETMQHALLSIIFNCLDFCDKTSAFSIGDLLSELDDFHTHFHHNILTLSNEKNGAAWVLDVLQCHLERAMLDVREILIDDFARSTVHDVQLTRIKVMALRECVMTSFQVFSALDLGQREASMAVVELPDLSSSSGLQEFNKYLSSRSCVSGDQPSMDDAIVLCALPKVPEGDLPNVSCWHNRISSLLQKKFPGTPVGVKFSGSLAVQTRKLDAEAPPAPETPPAAEAEDAEDLYLSDEEAEEEKKDAAERDSKEKAALAKKKESRKFSVLLDVKPLDNETDLLKLEEAVRSVSMPGLLWGSSELVPVGYGINKLQIMLTIVDHLGSVYNFIEECLTVEPRNKLIQSCDIVAFNEI